MDDYHSRLTPAMFRAAAKEIHNITFGVAKSKMHWDEVTPKLAGHWASRVLIAALRAELADRQWEAIDDKP